MLTLKTVNTQNEEKVTLDAKIIQVTSPSTVQLIAQERNINPQEVFVRVVFEHEGKQYKVSNKLKLLGKTGYTDLLKAKQDGATMKLTVGLESEFFYIERNVNIDDLFTTPVQPEKKSPFAGLKELINFKK